MLVMETHQKVVVPKESETFIIHHLILEGLPQHREVNQIVRSFLYSAYIGRIGDSTR